MIIEDEDVDYVHAKIGKQFYSCCSPTYFSSVMSELKPILGEQLRMRISDSPFCKWIDIPVLAISSGRLDYFLNRFDVPSCSFLSNDDVMIQFRSSDFSIVLVLHHSGQPVDLDLKMESRFLARHFASKVTKADRAAIRERMMLLAGSSFFVFLVCSCSIALYSPQLVMSPLVSYFRISMILRTFFNHAWGDAVFRFLYREICHLGSKMYVDGCIVGLMELLYESIPTLWVRRSLNLYPRLFRWGKSRIPLKSDEADTLLNRVDITQDQNMRHELNVKEAVVEKGEKSGEGVGKVEKSRGKAEFEIAHDATCSFYDVDVVVHNVVDELDEANKDGNEANNDVEGSEFSLSKVDEITVFQSSIVDNVRTRADRVKKRKVSIMGQAFVDVDEASNSLGEEELDEFRGRSDFIGHEKSSDEDRKLVIEFLGKEKLDVIVWEDKHMSLGGHALCSLLFREPVESEIINVYMRIMRQESLLNGSEIFCMDTNVQQEILEHLEKFGKRRKIQDTDYEAFVSRLSSFTRSRLMELNEEIFRRCREEGIFKLWNSKHDAFAVGTAKVYIRFLAGFLRHLSRFNLDSQDLVRERCRQQGPTLNCGVYSCMWLHCLAYDTPEIWKCQQKVDVNAYRVRIAATILGSITNVS
ncbi:hypothetical protein F511_35641 [Dorcoceras hygrometricum]|uniref:Uncharacterized protein n=1 Tax=Dorcoceras hygrometricum TaxID=472368 RepID=A0A2Z7BQV0_9LAMI|nr:hypothetical protein F511_35641 [Dorcoceras hygrometricum]